MAEAATSSEPFDISHHFLARTHFLRVGVSLEYMEVVLKALLEIIVNLRSEGKRIAGDTAFKTKSLQKLTERKILHPTDFSYEAIANDSLSFYYDCYVRDFKENVLADTIINEDKIYLNFYYLENLRKKDVINVWETWEIKVVISPMTPTSHIERELSNIASTIIKNVVPPLPLEITLRECKKTFKCCLDQAWLYRNFIRQGSNFCSDHVLHVNTTIENISRILSIVFDSILYYRCTSKLTPSQDGKYKSNDIPFTMEYSPEFKVSYPRICCDDLGQLLRSKVSYLHTCVKNEYRPRKKITFYISFYRLDIKGDLNTTRKVCERWQIVCQMWRNFYSDLPFVVNYIRQSIFPDSLKVSPTLEYKQLYKHYFTTLRACTPPRFYIHT